MKHNYLLQLSLDELQHCSNFMDTTSLCCLMQCSRRLWADCSLSIFWRLRTVLFRINKPLRPCNSNILSLDSGGEKERRLAAFQNELDAYHAQLDVFRQRQCQLHIRCASYSSGMGDLLDASLRVVQLTLEDDSEDRIGAQRAPLFAAMNHLTEVCFTERAHIAEALSAVVGAPRLLRVGMHMVALIPRDMRSSQRDFEAEGAEVAQLLSFHAGMQLHVTIPCLESFINHSYGMIDEDDMGSGDYDTCCSYSEPRWRQLQRNYLTQPIHPRAHALLLEREGNVSYPWEFDDDDY